MAVLNTRVKHVFDQVFTICDQAHKLLEFLVIDLWHQNSQ